MTLWIQIYFLFSFAQKSLVIPFYNFSLTLSLVFVLCFYCCCLWFPISFRYLVFNIFSAPTPFSLSLVMLHSHFSFFFFCFSLFAPSACVVFAFIATLRGNLSFSYSLLTAIFRSFALNYVSSTDLEP